MSAFCLERLPEDIRVQLVDANIEDHQQLAKKADALWAAKDMGASTSAIQQRPRKKAPTSTTPPAAGKLCFYHRKFGSSAHRSQEPCTWSGPEVLSATGTKDHLLFVTDQVSGRQFLVDTGAEVSVIPATGLDTRIEQPGHTLTAANGSRINMYGT